MTAGRRKDIQSKQELEQDWYPNKPGMPNDARIKRIAAGTETRQAKVLAMTQIPENIPEPNYSTVYVWKKSIWQLSGFKCLDCGKLFPKVESLEKHPLVCNKGLKINREEEQELLKLVRNYNANS